MLIRVILSFMSFVSGIFAQAFQTILEPFRQIMAYIHDFWTFLLTDVPAFTLAWGWIRWLIPTEVWAIMLVVLTLEALVMSIGLAASVFRILKAWLPFM